MDGHSKKLGWMRISLPPVAAHVGIPDQRGRFLDGEMLEKIASEDQVHAARLDPGHPLQSAMRRSTSCAAKRDISGFRSKAMRVGAGKLLIKSQ